MHGRAGLLFGLVAALGGCSTTSSMAPTSTPVSPPLSARPPEATDAAPSTGQSAVPTATDAATRWTLTYHRYGARLVDALATPNGVVAGGCIADPNDVCVEALLLTSADGARWDEIHPEGTADASISDFVVVDDRLFAIGRRLDNVRFVLEPMVWTSVNGASWSLIPIERSTNRDVQTIVGSPSGSVAIGIDAPYASEGSGFLSWPVDESGAFGAPTDASTPERFGFVVSAMWTGDRFLAWGDVWETIDEEGNEIASTVMLASTDGRGWSVLPDVQAFRNGTVSTVVIRGGRFVAIGYRGTQVPVRPGAWVSTDGEHWELASMPVGNGALYDVQVDARGLVAFGRAGFEATDGPLAWRSADGLVWEQLPEDELLPAVPGFVPRAPVTVGSRRCAVGSFHADAAPMSSAAIYCR